MSYITFINKAELLTHISIRLGILIVIPLFLILWGITHLDETNSKINSLGFTSLTLGLCTPFLWCMYIIIELFLLEKPPLKTADYCMLGGFLFLTAGVFLFFKYNLHQINVLRIR